MFLDSSALHFFREWCAVASCDRPNDVTREVPPNLHRDIITGRSSRQSERRRPDSADIWSLAFALAENSRAIYLYVFFTAHTTCVIFSSRPATARRRWLTLGWLAPVLSRQTTWHTP
jgi:hypothetical protein